MTDVLLARYADCIFWLARYVERAENLARILDVNETFSRDSRGGQNWLSILQLNADEKRFLAAHSEATAYSVVRFYVVDAGNPTSIVSAIRSARENARTLRPLISTEMWVQLNVFYSYLAALGEVDLVPGRLAALFGSIKEACQTHTGITDGTFFRDQGWYFYQLGRYIERADQTTRLLDIKYHLLLPSLSDVGSPIDVSQWHALLRSAVGTMRIGACTRRARPRRGWPVFCCSIRPSRARSITACGRLAGCSASSNRTTTCATATPRPKSSTACVRCSEPSTSRRF